MGLVYSLIGGGGGGSSDSRRRRKGGGKWEVMRMTAWG